MLTSFGIEIALSPSEEISPIYHAMPTVRRVPNINFAEFRRNSNKLGSVSQKYHGVPESESRHCLPRSEEPGTLPETRRIVGGEDGPSEYVSFFLSFSQ